MSGIFITFEGVDGCGKSTQIKFLAEYIKEQTKQQAILTREPGGCEIAEEIRALLLDVRNGEMDDKTEALLYAAARAQHVSEIILPALKKGKIVLCDRFLDSSLAYQGVGRGLGIDNILCINQFALDGLMPDYTFFLDLSPEDAFKRMSKRKEHDRLESQEEVFYTKLYNGFMELLERWPERFIKIDATGSKMGTQKIIRNEMDRILANR